jgi:MFS family permease
MAERGSFHLFRRPMFRRLWIASFLSDTGDWLLIVALPVYVLLLTGSGLVTSTVLAVEVVVGIVGGQLAGLVVDSFDRRIVIVACSIAQALALLPLLAVSDAGDIWIVYAVTAVETALGTFTGVAYSTIIPGIIEGSHLVAGNSLLGISTDVARLFGASAGGFALAWGGLPAVVIVDAVSFLAVWLLFARHMPASPPGGHEPSGDRTSPWRRWLEGYAVVRRDRRLWGGITVAGMAGLAQGIALVGLVVFVIETLDRSSAAVGSLRGIAGIGTILGGLAMTLWGDRFAYHKVGGFSLIAAGLAFLATWNGPAVTTEFWYYLVFFVLAGAPGTTAFVAIFSLLQRATTSDTRGRVFGLLGSVNNAMLGLGLIVGGALIDRVPPRALLDWQGGLLVTAGVLALIVLRPHAHAPKSSGPSESSVGTTT